MYLFGLIFVLGSPIRPAAALWRERERGSWKREALWKPGTDFRQPAVAWTRIDTIAPGHLCLRPRSWWLVVFIWFADAETIVPGTRRPGRSS